MRNFWNTDKNDKTIWHKRKEKHSLNTEGEVKSQDTGEANYRNRNN